MSQISVFNFLFNFFMVLRENLLYYLLLCSPVSDPPNVETYALKTDHLGAVLG